MNKIILLLVLLTSTLFAGTTYKNGDECKCDSLHVSYQDEGELIFEIPLQLINGNYIESGIERMYRNNRIVRTINLEYGVRNGTLILYDTLGNQHYTMPYVNGKQHGTSYSLHTNNHITKKVFANGLLMLDSGLFTHDEYYYDSTSLQVTRYYGDKDNRDNRSGYSKYEFDIKNGELGNQLSDMHWSYNKRTDTPYVNGKVHGDKVTSYRTGQIYSIMPYINGKKQGIVKWYYQNGVLAGTAKYNNNKLVGYIQCTDGRMGNSMLNCTIK